MNELKVRAWDTQLKTYLYSGYGEKTFGIFAKRTNCRRFIIEQYTGIKDINGKEIYEGDIDESGMVVTYCGDQEKGLGMNCGWYLQNNDFERWTELESRCNANGDNYKIVGNIHENPELIE